MVEIIIGSAYHGMVPSARHARAPIDTIWSKPYMCTNVSGAGKEKTLKKFKRNKAVTISAVVRHRLTATCLRHFVRFPSVAHLHV